MPNGVYNFEMCNIQENFAAKKPNDFIIATGKQFSIKQFIEFVLKELNIKVKWSGKGINEKAFDENGRCIIKCHKRYLRPAEVETLLGNPKKALKYLKWKPQCNITALVKDMVSSELKELKK